MKNFFNFFFGEHNNIFIFLSILAIFFVFLYVFPIGIQKQYASSPMYFGQCAALDASHSKCTNDTKCGQQSGFTQFSNQVYTDSGTNPQFACGIQAKQLRITGTVYCCSTTDICSLPTLNGNCRPNSLSCSSFNQQSSSNPAGCDTTLYQCCIPGSNIPTSTPTPTPPGSGCTTPGEHNPHLTCDSTSQKCQKIHTCGIDTCAIVDHRCTITTTPTSTPTPTPPSSLSNYPNTAVSSQATSLLSLTQIAPNKVGITIDAGNKAISAVQAEISYNPQVLTNIIIIPGNFFNNPFMLFNRVDQTNGIIFFAITNRSALPSSLHKGTIATISYNSIPGIANPTTINFLPKTKITTQGIDTSILKQATGITITLP